MIRKQVYEQELELGESFSLVILSQQEWNTKYLVSPYRKAVLEEGIVLQ